MKIKLRMNGRERSFSQEELISKLKRLEELEKQFTIKASNNETVYRVARKPIDNMCFKVYPNSINESLFKKEKTDFMQEWTRNIITSALRESKRNPRKYSKQFATLIPEKTWHYKTVEELKVVARSEGDHIANWVEQGLEWAQRLTNGESWEDICNKPDTLNWYRLIIWKNNHAKIVGGSHMCGDSLPPCTVFGNYSNVNDVLHYTVPLIVVYL